MAPCACCPLLAALSIPRLPEAAVPVLKFFNQTDFKIQDRYGVPACNCFLLKEKLSASTLRGTCCMAQCTAAWDPAVPQDQQPAAD